MVQVTADMEAPPPRCGVVADVEKGGVEVQVGAGVEALPDAPAVLLAQRLAAQLGGRGDVDDVMSQRPVDEPLDRQTVLLEEAGEVLSTPSGRSFVLLRFMSQVQRWADCWLLLY